MNIKSILILIILLNSSGLNAQTSVLEKDKSIELFDKQKRTESMLEHSISVNPFLLPLLSANLRYNYFFTRKMHWALNVRTTFISRVLDNVGDDTYLMMGAGIKYVPLYYKILALGVDFTPTYMIEIFPSDYSRTAMFYPLSLNIDLILSDFVGAAIDFGAAYVTGDVFERKWLPRAHVGIMFMFGQKRSIFPANESRF